MPLHAPLSHHQAADKCPLLEEGWFAGRGAHRDGGVMTLAYEVGPPDSEDAWRILKL